MHEHRDIVPHPATSHANRQLAGILTAIVDLGALIDQFLDRHGYYSECTCCWCVRDEGGPAFTAGEELMGVRWALTHAGASIESQIFRSDGRGRVAVVDVDDAEDEDTPILPAKGQAGQ